MRASALGGVLTSTVEAAYSSQSASTNSAWLGTIGSATITAADPVSSSPTAATIVRSTHEPALATATCGGVAQQSGTKHGQRGATAGD
jgi:hypothetical protein